MAQCTSSIVCVFVFCSVPFHSSIVVSVCVYIVYQYHSDSVCVVHAAVLAINEAVVQGDVGTTALALRNPNAMLERLQGALMAVYQEMLQQARTAKTHSAATGVGGASPHKLQPHWLSAI